MKLEQVEKLFSKLDRLNPKLNQIEGNGTSWKYISPNGKITNYSITKIRDLRGIQDDVENYLIWLWNLKDYFKSVTLDKREIEEFINKNSDLKILADVANKLKHFELDSSRSGLFPSLGDLKIVFPHKNYSMTTFKEENKIEVEPKDVSKCEINLPIFDKDGNELIDSFDLIKKVEIEWRKFFKYVKFNNLINK